MEGRAQIGFVGTICGRFRSVDRWRSAFLRRCRGDLHRIDLAVTGWPASASTRDRAVEPATIAALLVQGYTHPATPWLCSGPCTGPSLGQAPAPAAYGRNASATRLTP